MSKYPLSSIEINSVEDDVKARYEMALEVHKDVLKTNKKHREVLDKQLVMQAQLLEAMQKIVAGQTGSNPTKGQS